MRRHALALIGLSLGALMICGLWEACAKPPAQQRLQYVATIAPLGMILREVVGGRAEVRVLLQPGADPHTYEPKPSDIQALSDAKALFWDDELLDGWAAEVGGERKIKLFALVPDQLKLLMPAHHHDHGGQTEEADQASHHTAADDREVAEESGHALDPHFWTSPRVVQAMLPGLVAELSRLDPPGAAEYQSNAERFGAELGALDQELAKTLAQVKGQYLILVHPSFMYLMHDYGLELGAVLELSPGQEPSPQYLAEVTELCRKLQVRAVFSEPQLAIGPAQTIAQETGLPLYVLDGLGGIPGRATYSELLRYSVGVLAQALAAPPG